MFTFNGFGTRIYGKREVNPQDNSYVVTKWITALYFPIVPLGSYRVIRDEASKKFWTGGFPKYQMTKIEINIRQIIYTYLAWWGIPLVLIIWASFYG